MQPFNHGKWVPWIAAAVVLYVALFFLFYPSFYSSGDEHQILDLGVGLWSGNAFQEDIGYACLNTQTNAGYFPFTFFGRPLSLVPFVGLGLSAVFLSGLLIHLINLGLLGLLFKKFSLDLRWLILYLFYPAFFWASRTLFAELLTATFVLAAFYWYDSPSLRKRAVAGLACGLAFLTRFDSLGIFFIFALPMIWNAYKTKAWKPLAAFALGFAPALLLFVGFNWTFLGSPLTTLKGSVGGVLVPTGWAWWMSIVSDFVAYGLFLLVAYPLLLYAVARWDKGKEHRLVLLVLVAYYLFVNARFTDFFAFGFSIPTLFTARLRYLVPLLPVLLVPYVAFIEAKTRGISPKLVNAGYALLFLLLVGGTAYGMSVHQNLLDNRAQTFDQIYAHVPAGVTLVGSADDCLYTQETLFRDIRYVNIQTYLENPPQGDVYFMHLTYSYRADRDSSRQEVVENEGKLIQTFVSENVSSLEKVFETQTPNQLTIYRRVES